MKVGVIGLGQMGGPMALRLIAAGHEVTVYNRDRQKAEAFADLGASVAPSIAKACAGDAVLTMLSDDGAVEAVVLGAGGVVESSGSATVHISSSTISVALAERLTEAHEAAGQSFVSAPVFGRPAMAEQGKLFLVAAGANETLAEVAPVLDALGQRTFVFGDEPRIANLVKLSGNLLIGSVLESLGEAMALVGKAGVDRRGYLDFLTSSLFDTPIYHTYGGLVADRAFTPAKFPAPLGLKDVRLVLEAGDQMGVPLPIANLLRDRLLTLIARGGEDLDWSALGALAAHDAGEK